MEMDELIDFQVGDHIHNCRFCFRPFTDHQKSVEITEKIKQKFFELAQFQLIQDEAFSNKICILCLGDLEFFSKYRYDQIEETLQRKLKCFSLPSSSILERQKKLYEIRFKQVDAQGLQEVRVKEELLEELETEDVFIDCSTFVSNDGKTSKLFEKTAAKKKKQDKCHREIFDDITVLLKTTKSKIVQCPKCYKTLHRDSLKEHFCSVHLNIFKFRCDICGFEASRRTRLLMHLKNQHKMEVVDKGVIKPKKKCNHCGTMVKDWRRHILKVHLNVKNFFCDICPYGAFFKYDLEQHMKTHIKKHKGVEKYFCDMCGLEFEKRFHLNAHVKAKHTVKERVHQCTVCKKTFFTAENLKKHAESHEARDKPCEFCGKLFTCMNNLRTHLYYHSEPKFVCDFPNCDKKFFMKKRLRAHLKSHRGQKDFICEICKKSYFSQNDLNRHTFSIHEKLRFFCKVPGCHGNFSRREYYKKHALAHHQNLGTDYLETLLHDIKMALPSQKF